MSRHLAAIVAGLWVSAFAGSAVASVQNALLYRAACHGSTHARLTLRHRAHSRRSSAALWYGQYQKSEGHFTRAFGWFHKAAEAGNAVAALEVARATGRGIALSDVRGDRWLRRAARGGDVYAELLCADQDYDGAGASQNIRRALFWYRKAAHQGNAAAQFQWGRMEQMILGGATNRRRAIVWLNRAARQGDTAAQLALA